MMHTIRPRTINWNKTRAHLTNLRLHNKKLRKKICHILGLVPNCNHDCQNCEDYYVDRIISQAELAKVFLVNAATVANWEFIDKKNPNGRSKPRIEHLMFYSQLCELPLEEILIFED